MGRKIEDQLAQLNLTAQHLGCSAKHLAGLCYRGAEFQILDTVTAQDMKVTQLRWLFLPLLFSSVSQGLGID